MAENGIFTVMLQAVTMRLWNENGKFGRWHAFFACALIIPLVALVPAVQAAEIKVVDANWHGFAVIVVDGAFKPQDGEKFATVAATLSRAIVAFNSPGGAVVAALQMGQVIRLKSFATFSPEGAYCASACAIAWLAGTPRLMQPGSRIGFHAAYDADTHEQTGVGNALIGAYLDRLGLSPAAIVYVEQARPDDITWLTPADVRHVGIKVIVVPARSEPDQDHPPEQRPESKPVTSAPRGPSPEVLPMLVGPSARPEPARVMTLDDRARAFVADYFAHWSEANPQALGYFATVYSPKIVFYGDTIERATLMQKKRDYTARWPVRIYTARPNAIRSFCNDSNKTCVVTGVVDWDCRSPERNARSTGSANFSLTISFGDATPQVLAEAGSVISRQVE